MLQIMLFQFSHGFPTRQTWRFSIYCRCSTRCGFVQTCVQYWVVTFTCIGFRLYLHCRVCVKGVQVPTTCHVVDPQRVNIISDMTVRWCGVWFLSVHLTNCAVCEQTAASVIQCSHSCLEGGAVWESSCISWQYSGMKCISVSTTVIGFCAAMWMLFVFLVIPQCTVYVGFSCNSSLLMTVSAILEVDDQQSVHVNLS